MTKYENPTITEPEDRVIRECLDGKISLKIIVCRWCRMKLWVYVGDGANYAVFVIEMNEKKIASQMAM